MNLAPSADPAVLVPPPLPATRVATTHMKWARDRDKLIILSVGITALLVGVSLVLAFAVIA